MPGTLQLKFDANQSYQLEAIQAVVDALHGLPKRQAEFALGYDVVPNLPPYESLDESWLYENVAAVQERNGIPSESLFGRLETDEGLVLDGAGNESWRYPSFTIEMETGTGKTYVYLRTIHELRQRYGLGKFVIVVPSIAIYEGVIKNFRITRGHFAAIYGSETANLVCYDGSRLSSLRAFATSTFVEILVMTLDSFNKKTNVIFRPSEQLPGERLPFQYIQETRPILILDEPQNMESRLAQEALRTLHPLFALRYSATHRRTPNLLYRLTPFDAYRRNLVKKIQVDAVTEWEEFNRPFLALDAISTRPRITATVRTYLTEKGRSREGVVVLHQGDDLRAKTLREEHAGYRVTEIHAGEGFVAFENGLQLRLAEHVGPARPELFRVQIQRTVEEHMVRQDALLGQGIKVLSLFFIDRVANFVADDGIIRQMFDEAFDRAKARYPHFASRRAHEVREGYFATRKVKGGDSVEAVDTPVEEAGKRKADRDAERAAFELIMRDKERLLSLDEPVCFVFAHSALKEGWDNPNVFQICTLNQTVSEMKKRQEIGRGMRLAVNQEGERVFDEAVNVLTVVANESYERYVSLLQTEYVEEGFEPPPRPTPVRRATARRNDVVYQDNRFRAFWDRLSQASHYSIAIDTPSLIEACVERLNNDNHFYELRPVIVVERGEYVVTEVRLTLEWIGRAEARIRVETSSTAGQPRLVEAAYGLRCDLAKACSEPRLRGYSIVAIEHDSPSPHVVFGNGQELHRDRPLIFHSEAGQVPRERTVVVGERPYPVFNLVDRSARETGLTRRTVNGIYRGLTPTRQSRLITNPEGFAGWFIGVVRNTLADHVVDRLGFEIGEAGEAVDLEVLFPPVKEFPQKELVPGGPVSLYDQVQTDSEVEVRFVGNRLVPDEKVICYFKFPPAFKVPLPKIVGSYNPDWGILRYHDDGRVVLQLVRETKGSADLKKLQFPHEQRKLRAARKHFREIGVDYRFVTDKTIAWWLPGEDMPHEAGGESGLPAGQ